MTTRNNQEYSDEQILAALVALTQASTWNETGQVFNANFEVLISDHSFEILCEIIQMHRTNNEVDQVENWNQYLQLLEETVRFGPHKAWSRFSDLQNRSAEAVELFIGAGTQEEKRDILIAHKKLLLSNPAFVYLRGKIEQERDAKDDEFVEYLMPHLRILEAVRQHGIAAFTDWKTIK